MTAQTLFALDIGTRKIVGLVLEKNESGFKILGSEMQEHRTRAMMDGQIHDVGAVAETISSVKSALEEKMQIKLERASVAAAGRSLQTSTGHAEKHRNPLQEVDPNEVRALELEAVQMAQQQLFKSRTSGMEISSYFCVGYSVMGYYLEGQQIGSLIGQRGEKIQTSIIATFLPRVVVDSLFAALKKAGLEIYNMTLEPIAALSVAIPPEMRSLNLALVDIGAGTSDIAIVKDGNIYAYAMVPCAGDELTERVASEYLLDFYTAEKVKRQLAVKKKITVKDILGNKLNLKKEEVSAALEPTLKDLCTRIAYRILELNQKPPDAVVCVGGGSLTPGLIPVLAEKLGITGRRVGLRTPLNFNRIEVQDEYLQGPQGVTPLGIAYNSLVNAPAPFIKVTVNDREIPLWNVTEITVANALLSSGIVLGNIYGRPGMGKTVEINGSVRSIRGETGQPPLIRVNNEEAGMETLLRDGDRVQFVPGVNGKDARFTAGDLVPEKQGSVTVNGKLVKLQPYVYVNGELANHGDEIPDRARVEFTSFHRLDNILKQCGVPEHLLQDRIYSCSVNGGNKTLKWKAVSVQVDGKEGQLYDVVENGTDIVYTMYTSGPKIKEFVEEFPENIKISINGEPVVLPQYGSVIYMNGVQVNLEDQIVPGAEIQIEKNQSTAILSDIFAVIDIKPMVQRKLSLRVNGQEAGYTTPLADGSNIDIVWEDDSCE